MMTRGFRIITAALITVFALLSLPVAYAQDYPTRPVTIIVPTGPGGGTDIIARLIGAQLAQQLGQAFVIDNRPGAGLLVGTTAAAKAEPDGYTLLLGLNGSMAVNPSLFSKLPYDPIRDFTPVAMLADYPFLVVVNKDLPVRSTADLIELAKSKPGELNYGSAGNGTGQHLSTELFKMMTGTNLAHVPYRSAQAVYSDVISGRVPVFFDNISGALALVQSDKVSAIGVTTHARSPVLPDVPTVAETVPGFEYHTWFGLWAPRKTPRPVVEKLNTEVGRALSSPAVTASIRAAAGEPATIPLADIEPFVAAEIAKWADVVKRAGVKVD
jgi:tripartite-type tricarboxylate transporter receptor subunit TctC